MYNSSIIAERIKKCAKEKHIVIKMMLEECELSKNTLSTMLSAGFMPKSENLLKIAEYLDCSVDYLLGRTDNPTSHKSAVIGDVSNVSNNSGIVGSIGSTINAASSNPQESVLFEIYKQLDPIKQAKLLIEADRISKE